MLLSCSFYSNYYNPNDQPENSLRKYPCRGMTMHVKISAPQTPPVQDLPAIIVMVTERTCDSRNKTIMGALEDHW